MYRCGLHIFGLVLAFLTLNIKIDFRYDYHYNTAIIFGSTGLFLTLFSPYILIDYPTVLGFIGAFNKFLASTLYLGLTFIPKVHCSNFRGYIYCIIQIIALSKDPQEKSLTTAKVDIKPTKSAQPTVSITIPTTAL